MTDSSRSLFFSFEGIDGSGKSTQARLLAEALQALGHAVTRVREPGGTPLGESIRSLLLSPEAQISARAELLLFAAARAQLVESVIEPSLASGVHVIADRFTDSTEAYQGAGRGLQETLPVPIARLNTLATMGREPDRTYLIAISLNESQRRLSRRHMDRMEATDASFRERVAAEYRDISERNPDRVLALDGTESPAILHRTIREDAVGLIHKWAGSVTREGRI